MAYCVYDLLHFKLFLLICMKIGKMELIRKRKARIYISVSALWLPIWTCRNNIIFNKIWSVNFFQVIILATHWIHLGLSCSRKINGSVWLLDATGCRWLLRISTTWLVGGILVDYIIGSYFMPHLFRWLIPYMICTIVLLEPRKLKNAMFIIWCRPGCVSPIRKNEWEL
jgi:hypothetical protein